MLVPREGVVKGNGKKVHNGSENSENQNKYGVKEKSVKKFHDLGDSFKKLTFATTCL